MSKTIARMLAGVSDAITAPMKPYRRRITRALICERMAQTVSISANGAELRFHATTARALHDVLHLGNDEPETVRWLDNLRPGVLWDVGANVGLYALYAAALGHRVIAFEPSSSTFAALCKNIELNDACEKVSAYCVALGGATGIETLWMTDSSAGHSMHSIRERSGRRIGQAVPVFSFTDFQSIMGAPAPDYIKIDVDGIEAEILTGAGEMPSVQSVIIEAESADVEQRISEIVGSLGFQLNQYASAGRTRNLVFDRPPPNPSKALP